MQVGAGGWTSKVGYGGDKRSAQDRTRQDKSKRVRLGWSDRRRFQIAKPSLAGGGAGCGRGG